MYNSMSCSNRSRTASACGARTRSLSRCASGVSLLGLPFSPVPIVASVDDRGTPALWIPPLVFMFSFRGWWLSSASRRCGGCALRSPRTPRVVRHFWSPAVGRRPASPRRPRRLASSPRSFAYVASRVPLPGSVRRLVRLSRCGRGRWGRQTFVLIWINLDVETGIDANSEDPSVVSCGLGHSTPMRPFDLVGWHAVFVPVIVVLIHPLPSREGR